MKRFDPVVAAYLDELVSGGFLALDQAGRVDARASCGDTSLHFAVGCADLQALFGRHGQN